MKHQYLVRVFENGQLYDWFMVSDSKDIQKIISRFYFPDDSEGKD